MKNQSKGGASQNDGQMAIEPKNNKLEKTNKIISDEEGNVILDEMDQECIYLKNTIQEQMIYGRSVMTLEEIENTTFTIENDQLVASNNFGLAIQGYFDNAEHNAFDDYRKAVGKFSENELASLKNEAMQSEVYKIPSVTDSGKKYKHAPNNRITGLDNSYDRYKTKYNPLPGAIAVYGGGLDKPFVQRVAGIDSKIYNKLFPSFHDLYRHTRTRDKQPIVRIKDFVEKYLGNNSNIKKFAYLSYSGTTLGKLGAWKSTIGDAAGAQIDVALVYEAHTTYSSAFNVGDNDVTLQYFDIPNEKNNWSNFKYMMIFNAIILKEIMSNISEDFADLVNLVFAKESGDTILEAFIKTEIPSGCDAAKCKIRTHYQDNPDTLIMPFEYTLVCNSILNSEIDYKVFIGDILVNKGDSLTFNGFNDKPDNDTRSIDVIIKTLIEAYKFKIAFTIAQADNLTEKTKSQIFLKVRMPKKDYRDETLKIPTYQVNEVTTSENMTSTSQTSFTKRKIGDYHYFANHDIDGSLNKDVVQVPQQTNIDVTQITYYDANNKKIKDDDVNKFNQNQQYYVPCNDEKPQINHEYTLKSSDTIADFKYYKYNNIFNHMADNGHILPEDKPMGNVSDKKKMHSDIKKNLHTIAGITSQLIYKPSTLIENLNININDSGTMVPGKDGRYTKSWVKEADNGKWRLLGLYQDDPDSPFVSDKDNKCINLDNKQRAKRLYYRVGAWYRIDAVDKTGGGRGRALSTYRIKATLMITHRGSVTWRDWKHDDLMISTGLGQMNTRIHDFYWNILPEIVNDMNKKIRYVVGRLNKPVDSVNVSTYVSGHSLGGYLALSTAKNSIYDARPGTGSSNTTWAANIINKISKNTAKRQEEVDIMYVNYIYPIVMNPFLGASNKDAVEIAKRPFGKIFDDFLHSIPSGDLYHVYNPYEITRYNNINQGWDNASERLDIFNVKHTPTYDSDNRYKFEEIKNSYANNRLVFHNMENALHVAGPVYGPSTLAVFKYLAHAHGVHQFIGLDNNNIINPPYNDTLDSNEYLHYQVPSGYFGAKTKQIAKVNKTGIDFSKATTSDITGGKKKSKTNKKKTRIRHKKMNKKTLKKRNKKTRRKKQTRRKIKKRTRKYRK